MPSHLIIDEQQIIVRHNWVVQIEIIGSQCYRKNYTTMVVMTMGGQLLMKFEMFHLPDINLGKD